MARQVVVCVLEEEEESKRSAVGAVLANDLVDEISKDADRIIRKSM